MGTDADTNIKKKDWLDIHKIATGVSILVGVMALKLAYSDPLKAQTNRENTIEFKADTSLANDVRQDKKIDVIESELRGFISEHIKEHQQSSRDEMKVMNEMSGGIRLMAQELKHFSSSQSEMKTTLKEQGKNISEIGAEYKRANDRK